MATGGEERRCRRAALADRFGPDAWRRWQGYELPYGPRSAYYGRRSAALHERLRGIIFIQVMNDALEKRLVEALKRVDAHGDVAPAYVHDPMTILLRENAVQANLVRWDEDRGRYVLTGTGRRRISAGSRVPGTVLSFRRLGAVGGIAPPRNPAGTKLKD